MCRILAIGSLLSFPVRVSDLWSGNPGKPEPPPVKNLTAQAPQRQDRVVGPARRRHRHAGILHFADKDRVIAHLHGIHELTFDEGRRFLENRRAQAALAKRLAADRITLTLKRFEERER